MIPGSRTGDAQSFVQQTDTVLANKAHSVSKMIPQAAAVKRLNFVLCVL
jgi:hypothetical protein